MRFDDYEKEYAKMRHKAHKANEIELEKGGQFRTGVRTKAADTESI